MVSPACRPSVCATREKKSTSISTHAAFAHSGQRLSLQAAFQGAAIRQPGAGIDSGLFAKAPLEFKLPCADPQAGQ